MNKIKICKTCRQKLTIKDFWKEKKNIDGLQGSCKKCNYKKTKIWIENNKEKHRKTSAKWTKLWRENHKKRVHELKKLWSYNRRNKVLSFYGGIPPRCKMCGEKRFEVLVTDHINNDGYKHRKSIRSKDGHATYNWIIKNNFPKGFQVLCHNCNWIKRNKNYEKKFKQRQKELVNNCK